MNLRHPIVTNGDFVVSLCGSAYSDRDVVWRGEWGGPRHSCVRWKSTCLKGKGLFLAWFLASFGIFVQYFTMATYGYTDILIDNRFVCEKLAVFPYARYAVEFCVEASPKSTHPSFCIALCKKMAAKTVHATVKMPGQLVTRF